MSIEILLPASLFDNPKFAFGFIIFFTEKLISKVLLPLQHFNFFIDGFGYIFY